MPRRSSSKENFLWLIGNFPRLRVIIEHLSTKVALDAVMNAGPNVAATITPHHLLVSNKQMLGSRNRPDYYCKPVPKTYDDIYAILGAIRHQAKGFGRLRKLFAGTDSAPHVESQKVSHKGCAGVYNAPVAHRAYLQILEDIGCIDHFADFTSRIGREFYRRPETDGTRRLHFVKRPSAPVPDVYEHGRVRVVPFLAGHTLELELAAVA